jgi:hypothetical protein
VRLEVEEHGRAIRSSSRSEPAQGSVGGWRGDLQALNIFIPILGLTGPLDALDLSRSITECTFDERPPTSWRIA